MIRIGQTLIILPVSGVQHLVKKGDTIESIAKKYKGDAAEIRDFNDLSVADVLAVGDTIIIPDGETATIVFSPGASKSVATYPSYQGYYAHPLPTVRKKTQGIHGYNGVDLAAPQGEMVLAAAEGTVIISRFRTAGNPWFGGYGNYIVVEHQNGTQTLYAHLHAVYVSVGVRVSKGQPIGEVGSTGKSTGPHLHFEVRGAKNPF
jgi:murein DD-endopeptidase MepM/ murein hydrolase activator NlpD